MIEKEICQITDNGIPCKNEGYTDVMTSVFEYHTFCKEHYERAEKRGYNG